MGSTGYKPEEDISEKFKNSFKRQYTTKHIPYENLPKELKDIPNNGYCCNECNLIPEILNINYKKGELNIKCQKHGEKQLKLEKYLQEQFKYLYDINNKSNINIYDKTPNINNSCKYSFNNSIIDNKNSYNIEILKIKRNNLIQNKELEEYLIKLLDILIITYEKNPNNSYNNNNISNIMKNIEENKNEKLLDRINLLEKKILNYLTIKFDLKLELKGNEIELDLRSKNMNNFELNLLNGIKFNLLENLNLSCNNIKNLELLKELYSPNLKKMNLAYNKINNINPLVEIIEKNKKMEYINLSGNLISDTSIFTKNKFNRNITIVLKNNVKKDLDEIRYMIAEEESNNIGENNKKKLNNIIKIFKLKYKMNDGITQIFGNKFVLNNKNNCKIKINGVENEICENLSSIKVEEKIIILEIDRSLTNMEDMFLGCKNLISLEDISNLNIANINNMCNMFNGCSSLTIMKNISKWKTSNVTNMKNMFRGCESLLPIEDISNWDVSNVNDISGMFFGCKSLIFLPKISKWNISNVNNLNDLFKGCSRLKTIPDISKWNTSNVKNMYSMISGCKSLTTLLEF